MKEEDLVEVEETYNKEGFLVKITANGIPLHIPKQDFPRVKINMQNVEWVTEKVFMTKEEADKLLKN